MSSHAQAFETLSLWEKLASSDQDALRQHAQILHLRPRQILLKENAPFVGLHIVKAGNLKLCRRSGAKEQILEILGPGAVVDPIPLFDGGNHAVTAQAMTEAQVYRFMPEAARTVLMQSPATLNLLLNLMSVRLRRLAALANDLAFKDVTARVCQVLLEQAAREETHSKTNGLDRPLTRQELASMVGTAREVAWRTLKRLEREGLIDIQGQRIVILDAAALAARV